MKRMYPVLANFVMGSPIPVDFQLVDGEMFVEDQVVVAQNEEVVVVQQEEVVVDEEVAFEQEKKLETENGEVTFTELENADWTNNETLGKILHGLLRTVQLLDKKMDSVVEEQKASKERDETMLLKMNQFEEAFQLETRKEEK